MSAGIKMVGANGFEPSSSWSRTRHLNPINALFGVAYGTRSVISPLSVVPNLYLEFEVTPCSERGFLCSLASLLPCCPTRPQPVNVQQRPSEDGFWLIALVLVYSVRNACIGSIRDALHAGTRQARAATTSMEAATDAKIAGSSGRVP